MSGYLAINAVSGVLQRIIADACGKDNMTKLLVKEDRDISLANPTETAQHSDLHLSLWLYRITENEFLKNVPAPPESDRNARRIPPLAVDLSYLVTPFTDKAENDQVLLGKVMQVLHDNGSIYVRNLLNSVVEEIRVVFCRMPLEEVTRIWEALQEPYRLSVCYLVRVIRIDSTRLDESTPVIEMTTGLAPLASVQAPLEGVASA